MVVRRDLENLVAVARAIGPRCMHAVTPDRGIELSKVQSIIPFLSGHVPAPPRHHHRLRLAPPLASTVPVASSVQIGFTFLFLKKISVATENGIPAEISRFSGDFDRKEFSNSKFRNFGFPVGISLHFAGIPLLFTEK